MSSFRKQVLLGNRTLIFKKLVLSVNRALKRSPVLTQERTLSHRAHRKVLETESVIKQVMLLRKVVYRARDNSRKEADLTR